MAAGFSRPRAPGASDIVAWLVAADIVLLLLHLLRRLPVDGGLGLPLAGSFWSLTDQRGLAASMELAQMGFACLLLLVAAGRRRTPAVLLAATALLVLFLTETFDLHIRLGRELRFLGPVLAEAGLPLPGAPAKLAALGIGGTALGLVTLAAGLAGSRGERRIVRAVALVLLLFLGIGGGLDLLGKLAVSVRGSLELAEETAELLIATFACARLMRVCPPPVAVSCGAAANAPSGSLRSAAAAARAP